MHNTRWGVFHNWRGGSKIFSQYAINRGGLNKRGVREILLKIFRMVKNVKLINIVVLRSLRGGVKKENIHIEKKKKK